MTTLQHKHLLPIVLASTSPRRSELLQTAGVAFESLAIETDEQRFADELAVDYIKRMVQQKAQAAQQNLPTYSDYLLITADTIGVLADGEILTKPIDKADAYRMWEKLSAKTHQIWTAVCICQVIGGELRQQRLIVECTEVDFVPLTESMKDSYWQTGEPVDKAGAYAIQGGAMGWVRAIRGSYTNVVGLPLAQTLSLLEELQGV